MRLWSFHPKYLNSRYLTACWYEGIAKAQAGLAGSKYKNHSQLQRFKKAGNAIDRVGLYLDFIHMESLRREFHYNKSLIKGDYYTKTLTKQPVTRDQLLYEWQHYLKKIEQSDPEWHARIKHIKMPDCHPMFYLTEGDIEEWEKVKSNKK